MRKKLSTALAASLICSLINAQVSVTTYHNDLARSGWNNNETILTPDNVNARQFGKIFSVPVDGDIYAQVLILSNVHVAGGTHNIAVVATTTSNIYAFDADNGNVFWSNNYTPPGLRTVRNTDFSSHCKQGQKDYKRDLGTVSTPVIDPNTETLYFVVRSTDADANGNGNYFAHLHAVDISTGQERPNSPALITGSVPGSGSDAVNGIVSFNPQHQGNRLALALYNGTVFITFASGQCDWRPYHGWIFGYDATSLQQVYIYNTTPRAMGGGIWESGGGIAIDDEGSMYVVSGNGFENSIGYNNNPSDLTNRAQSAIKLKVIGTELTPVDFFTPANGAVLNEGADLDNGSMSAFLIPNTKLYFTGCKDGNIYVLNTDNMGGFHASGDQIVQTISLGSGVLLRCHPAYYRSTNHEFAYVWSQFSQLKAIPFDRANNRFDKSKIKTGLETADPISANISTSSNNLQDGTGIVWISRPFNSGQAGGIKSQELIALDANDITKELWSSEQIAARDDCEDFMKFATPTIANGKVYLANGDAAINVFGIIDDNPSQPDCPGNAILSLNKPGFASSFPDNAHAPAKALDGNVNTAWSSSAGGTQWIYTDLGGTGSICNVHLEWAANNYGQDFLLQVSDNATGWTTVKSITGNNSTVNSINVNASGRYVRLFATASGSNGIYTLKEFEVYGSLINGCNTPTGLTVNDIDNASAVIRWNPTSTATGYTVRFKPKSSSVWQTFNTTEDTLLVEGLSCNTYYQYSVQSKCNADTSTSTNVGEFNTLGCNNCILPTRVNQTDVGNVGQAGLGCFVNPDNYSINGSGDDIGSNADAFHFVYYDFTGDADCKTKVASIDNVNPSNKAGIMIRESVDADSRSVFLGLTSSNKLVFLNRQNTGGNTITIVNQSGFAPPYFLKIVKKGSEFSGYVSPDNTNWTLIGSTINQMSTNGAHAGLAVTSHDNTQLSNAKFNGLTVNAYECGPLPKKTFASNIGPVSLTGNVCYYAYNRYVVNGSGNIANKTDAFFYVYQAFTGDKTITVKVTSQDQSNPLNKAGIMIRWTLAASQPNIFVGLTSGNGAVFQYRNGTNTVTQTTFTGNFKAPYFVRLVKSQGSIYSGYISSDGINWQQIGQVNIPPGTRTDFKAGMAVSSGDNSQLSNVIFDGWKIEDTSPLQISLSASSSNSAQNSNLLFSGGEENLKVYPNPTRKNFTIDCNIPKKQDIFVSIIGAGDGRIYFTQSVTNFSGNYHKEFNESAIPKGSYIISLKTRSGTKTKIFIKE